MTELELDNLIELNSSFDRVNKSISYTIFKSYFNPVFEFLNERRHDVLEYGTTYIIDKLKEKPKYFTCNSPKCNMETFKKILDIYNISIVEVDSFNNLTKTKIVKCDCCKEPISDWITATESRMQEILDFEYDKDWYKDDELCLYLYAILNDFKQRKSYNIGNRFVSASKLIYKLTNMINECGKIE